MPVPGTPGAGPGISSGMQMVPSGRWNGLVVGQEPGGAASSTSAAAQVAPPSSLRVNRVRTGRSRASSANM